MARIYVTLIPSLIFVALSDLLISKIMGKSIDLVEHYANLDIFIHNLFLIPSMPYGTMRPIWSLMYEGWIYVLFGGLFFFYKNFVVASILILIGCYYTIFVNGRGEAGPIWLIWTLGGLCVFLQDKIRWEKIRNSILNMVSIFLLLTSIVIYYISKNSYNIYAGLMISLFLFVISNSRNNFHRMLLARHLVLRKLAGFSFTLFLTHYTVLTYVKEFLGFDGWSGLVLGFALSNLVAFSIASVTEFRLPGIKLFLISFFMRKTSSVVK
jgi:peptidoglycan/LPS O-acetylase OafA/YrhL